MTVITDRYNSQIKVFAVSPAVRQPFENMHACNGNQARMPRESRLAAPPKLVTTE